jgi:hypothetical protein
MRMGIHLSHPAYPHEIDYNFGWMDGCSVLEKKVHIGTVFLESFSAHMMHLHADNT